MSLFALCDRCKATSIAVDEAYLREHMGMNVPGMAPPDAQKFGTDRQPWLRLTLPIPDGHPSSIVFTQKRVHLCNDCAAALFKWWKDGITPKHVEATNS